MSTELFDYETYKREFIKYINEEPCTGSYCGRIDYGNEIYSPCGPCPWGTRTNSQHICELCTDSPSLYDWSFLVFIAFGYLLYQIKQIDQMIPNPSNRSRIVLIISVLLEVIIASFTAVMVLDPVGELSLRSCRPRILRDWYSILCTKRTRTGEKLRCTQEAIYPLFTIVLYFFGICLVLMVSLRILLCAYFRCQKEALVKSMQDVLSVLPYWGLVYVAFAGAIYKLFPYVSIVVSVTYNARYFVRDIYQSTNSLVADRMFVPKNLMIVLAQWAVQAIGVVAITGLANPPRDFTYLFIIPMPIVLYVVTTCNDNLDVVVVRKSIEN